MILVNGQPADHLPVTDRGLAYGDGLFETLAVRHGVALYWDRHMARLREGCARLGLPAPDIALLSREAHTLLASGEYAALKLILTRGSGPRGYRAPSNPQCTRILMGLDASRPPPDWQTLGVDVRICRTRLSRNPTLAGIKHLNRLEQVLARAEWQDEFQEGIMLDTEGHVVEGTMSNLFMIRDGHLATPLLDQCGVAGITRARLMEMARGLGIPVRECLLREADLRAAQGLFLTNTLIGLWPVRSLEGRALPVPTMVSDLQQALAEMTA